MGDNPYGAPAGGDPYGAPPAGDPYGAAGAGAAGGGYGAPPPAGPYGQQPPGGYQATDAVGYGWKKFFSSPGTLLVPTLIAWIGIILISILVQFVLVGSLTHTHSCTTTVLGTQVDAQCGPSFFTRLLINGLASGVIFVVYQLLVAGLYRGALRVTDGQDFSVGQMFEGYDKAQVLIASLIIAVGVAIGTVLCYLPGLIVAFLTSYTMLFIIDRQLSAWDAIKASYEFVTKNLGGTLLYYVLAVLVTIAGACLCGVGLLAAIPITLIGYAYTYRRLQQQPVTPAA